MSANATVHVGFAVMRAYALQKPDYEVAEMPKNEGPEILIYFVETCVVHHSGVTLVSYFNPFLVPYEVQNRNHAFQRHLSEVVTLPYSCLSPWK